jgi:hypothetical protein
LANVRKAFASNAQLRIFNLANEVSRSFIQVVANFFQVQSVAFLYPVIVFPERNWCLRHNRAGVAQELYLCYRLRDWRPFTRSGRPAPGRSAE